ncbi:TRAP transporter permease [Arhodomonas sp. AD133]|uniref:TRAP transporter permease n=1 Tax=Arhodomonas sp. AD133 TaxID=3415009 RepID=UPI003EC0CEFF
MSDSHATPGVARAPWLSVMATAAAVALAAFEFYATSIAYVSQLHFNAVHVSLLLAIGFLMVPPGGRAGIGVTFASVALMIGLYVVKFEEALYARGSVMSVGDMVAASTAIALVLFSTWRAAGATIPILAIVLIGYVLGLGALLPGEFGFRGVSTETFLYRMFWQGEGLFGLLTTISASYVYLFVLLGALLVVSGATDFLLQAAQRVASRLPGGTAQAAVVGSALMGSVSGSAIANTTASGTVTIPMMKRSGYSAPFAAGVEASASTIGQLMPPVMGAGAFVMAQWTGTPYAEVIALAAIPALLFMYSLSLGIALHARRHCLRPSVDLSPIDWRLGVPFAAGVSTLVSLLVIGFTATYACVLACGATIIGSWFGKRPLGPRRLVTAATEAARGAMAAGLVLVCANLVVGCLNLSTKGVVLAGTLVSVGSHHVFLLVVVVVVVSLVLGMGLPVVASYVMVAVVAGPAFAELGVPLLAAHLMIFWYSQDANVTPPVALTAFVAAGLAGCRPMPAGLEAWRLSKGLYLIPLLFLDGDLLLANGWPAAGEAAAHGLVGLTALGVAIHGYAAMPVAWPWRVVLALLAFMSVAAPDDYQRGASAVLVLIMIPMFTKLPGAETGRWFGVRQGVTK